MGFSLCPTDETVESLFVNFWNWRPTVQLIASFGLIDDERLELMQVQCCGAEITAEEAGEIADRVERDILATLPENGRVLLDLSVTTEADNFRIYEGDEVAKNYSATADWLRIFVAFCRSSGGFKVL